MKKENYITVKCPHCGAEYTLDELFMPNSLLGKTKNIIKDPSGKIIGIEWLEPQDTTENYICDYCDKSFDVILDLKARTALPDEEDDFSTDITSLI